MSLSLELELSGSPPQVLRFIVGGALWLKAAAFESVQSTSSCALMLMVGCRSP